MDEKQETDFSFSTQFYNASIYKSSTNIFFEEQQQKDGQCFFDSEQFCYDSKSQKSSQFQYMIYNLIVDSDHFKYLKIKGCKEAIISIIQFRKVFQDDVQLFLDQMNLIIKKKAEIFTQYVNFDVIQNKQDQFSCSLYTIRPLDLQVVKCLSFIQIRQIKKIIKELFHFVYQSKIFFQKESFKEIMTDKLLLQFIKIQPNGIIKFDALYFFIKHFKNNITNYHSLFKTENLQKCFFTQYDQIILPGQFLQEQNVKIINDSECVKIKKSQDNNFDANQLLLTTCNYRYLMQFQKSQFNKLFFLKFNDTKESKLIDEKNNDQKTCQDNSQIQSTQDSNFQSIITIDNSNSFIQQQQQLLQQSWDQTPFFSKEYEEQELTSDRLGDENEKNVEFSQYEIIKKLIYQQGIQSIDEQVSQYNKINNKIKETNKTQNFNNINQKVYHSFLRTAKKIFYKHILKTSLIYYEESPFYYQNVMSLKEELQSAGEKFIQQKNFDNIYSGKEFWTLTPDEQTKVLGNIQNIQLSLKDFLTQTLMENPIRFTSCVRHTECLDISSVSYLQSLKQCPECCQFVGDYYEDKYLKFIIDFVSQAKTKENYQEQNECQNHQHFPYLIQSVSCNINNGIFVPMIQYIDQQAAFLDNSLLTSNFYPITNFVDPEYLYQIIKYNTRELEQQCFNPFQFFEQEGKQSTQQPILSIVNFSSFGMKFSFRLNKIFNENSFLEYPLRNSRQNCLHLDCFDLSDLFQINSVQNFQDNNLICPICNIYMKIEDIVYDKEYKNIINFVELSIVKKIANQNEEFQVQEKHYIATIDFSCDTITCLDGDMQLKNMRIQDLQQNFQEYKKIESSTKYNQSQSQKSNYDDSESQNDSSTLQIWDQLFAESKYINYNHFNSIQDCHFYQNYSYESDQTEAYIQIPFEEHDDETFCYFSIKEQFVKVRDQQELNLQQILNSENNH